MCAYRGVRPFVGASVGCVWRSQLESEIRLEEIEITEFNWDLGDVEKSLETLESYGWHAGRKFAVVEVELASHGVWREVNLF